MKDKRKKTRLLFNLKWKCCAKSKIECYTFHNLSHYANWEYYKAPRKIKEETKLVGDNQETEELTLLLQIKEEKLGDNNLQYLDSRATDHVCEYKDKFLKFDEKVKDAISFGDL